METYTALRQFADSWALLFLFLFFGAVILWVLRPGSGKTYQDTADIPFRHEDAPAPREGRDQPAANEEART